MNRVERSRLRKRRRAAAAFSFLLCFIIFALGIYMTNEVMKKTLSIKDDSSIISLPLSGHALKEKIGGISREKKIEIKRKVEDIYEMLKELLGGIGS